MAKNFVFVVGAGASKEFGLPTGKELLQQISNLARIDSGSGNSTYHFLSPIKEEISELAQDLEGSSRTHSSIELRRMHLEEKACWLAAIANLAPSIDNVLHTHKGDPEVTALGKLMIAHCLVTAEHASLIANRELQLNHQSIFPFVKNIGGSHRYVSETWLGELFRLLVELRTFEEFLSQLKRITFISFNYDRCIHQFIASCARLYFQLDDEKSRLVLSTINVIYPYGSLGDLTINQDVVFGFGSLELKTSIVAKRIKTFTESIDEGDIREKLHFSFENATDVFFLGFGFLNLNMRVLFADHRYDVSNVYGTHLGFSESSAKLIRKDIEKRLLWGKQNPEIVSVFETNGEASNIRLEDVTCTELLKRHHFLLRS